MRTFRIFLAVILSGMTGSSMAQLIPPDAPSLFMENIVSTNLSERDMTIAPDGSELFYTIQANQHAVSTIISLKKLPGNKWGKPEVASFSGKYSDLEPAFSHDGRKIFFSSNRPKEETSTKDYDIWYVEWYKIIHFRLLQ